MVGNSNRDSEFSSEKLIDSFQTESSGGAGRREQQGLLALLLGRMATKDYLARYLSAEQAEEQLGVKKKKRKKRKDPDAQPKHIKGSTVTIHDEDAVWAKDLDDHGTDEEDQPVVVETEEAAEPRRGQGNKGWTTLDTGEESSDASPVRRAGGGGGSSSSDSDAAPKRQRVRHDSDSDAEVRRPAMPARGQRHDSDSDSDAAPRRAGDRRHDSDSDDASPPRRATSGDGEDSDASPPRARGGAAESGQRDVGDAAVVEAGSSSDSDSDSDSSDTDRDSGLRMTNGQSVGLVRKEDISRQNAEVKAKERKKFEEASADSLGKHQETVYRDKRGRRLEQLEAFMASGEGGVKPDDEEAGMEWGKGLVQKRNQLSDAERLESMKNAPFARYADDKEMNDEMKETVRWGDPMLGMVSSGGRQGGGARKGQRPKCKHTAPKNRFGIPPGYRWDGVNRTNGFEGRLLRQAKEGEAAAEARYKWSVEDM